MVHPGILSTKKVEATAVMQSSVSRELTHYTKGETGHKYILKNVQKSPKHNLTKPVILSLHPTSLKHDNMVGTI